MQGLSGDRNWGIQGLLTGFQGVGGGKGKFKPNGNLGWGTKRAGDPVIDPGWSNTGLWIE